MKNRSFNIAHLALVVKDMEESVRFYCDVLGFDYAESFSTDMLEITYLKQGPLVLELLLHKTDPIPSRSTGLFDHLAFQVNDITREIDRLKKLGVQFQSEQPRKVFGGKTIIFFHGPNGERIELVEDSI